MLNRYVNIRIPEICRAALIVLFVGTLFCHTSWSDPGKGAWIRHQRQTPQGEIRSIHLLPDDTILVDTIDAFHTYDGARWRKLSYDTDVLGKDPPFTIDDDGRLYFINNGELHIYDNGAITSYSASDMLPPFVGAFSQDGTLYIGAYSMKSGIFSFDGDSITKLRDCQARSLSVDFNNVLWATLVDPGEQGMKLMTFSNDTWTDKTGEIGSTSTSLTVQTAPNGSIWVNNLGRYGIYQDDTWTFKDGGGAPMFLFFDNNGGIWGYGKPRLYRLDEDGSWQVSRTMENSIFNRSYYMVSRSDGSIFSFDGKYLYRYDENQEEVWAVEENHFDLASDTVTCITYTDDNKLMCGHGVNGVPYAESEKCGVSIYDGTTWFNYKEHEGVRFHNVYHMITLNDGDVMVYTDMGFELFDSESWEMVDSLYVDNVNDFMLDYTEELWIGAREGLVKYDFTSDYKTYLPPIDLSYNISFDNLFIDNYGVVYMQNIAGAILSYDKNANTLDRWQEEIGVDEHLRDFIIDPDEFIWGARHNNLSKWLGTKWEKVVSQDTQGEIVLCNASFIDYDLENRIWASGYDNTGYLEDGVWHRIPELSGMAADVIIHNEDGRIAMNAFDENRETFLGVIQYDPDYVSQVHQHTPERFTLLGNFPNPFNASTMISFVLPEYESVTITIYNIMGQRIKTLANRAFPPGKNMVAWDSTTDAGNYAASGIYFYRLKTLHVVETGSMTLLR